MEECRIHLCSARPCLQQGLDQEVVLTIYPNDGRFGRHPQPVRREGEPLSILLTWSWVNQRRSLSISPLHNPTSPSSSLLPDSVSSHGSSSAPSRPSTDSRALCGAPSSPNIGNNRRLILAYAGASRVSPTSRSGRGTLSRRSRLPTLSQVRRSASSLRRSAFRGNCFRFHSPLLRLCHLVLSLRPASVSKCSSPKSTTDRSRAFL
jgi:hypothetical protein